MILTSFFRRGGIPATGLLPLITVWEIQPALDTKIINAQPMLEVGDGIYKYSFAAFDSTKEYVIISDGGNTLPPNERYGDNSTNNENNSIIVNNILDEPAISHNISGSVGAFLNETHADAQQIRLDVILALDLLRTLLKYQKNRTKLDHIAFTLTVYDDDGITPLKVFDLRDRNGVGSLAEVMERLPRP